jgi:hypothetical protein
MCRNSAGLLSFVWRTRSDEPRSGRLRKCATGLTWTPSPDGWIGRRGDAIDFSREPTSLIMFWTRV